MLTVLLPCLVSFLVGLWLGSYTLYIPLTIVTLLLCLALAFTWCESRGRLTSLHSLLLYAFLLVGVGYWHIHDRGHYDGPLLTMAGEEEIQLSGVITDPVQHGPGRLTMLVDVTSIGEGPNEHRMEGTVRLTWRDPNTVVFRGDAITVRARLRAPFGTRNPGGFDYGAYLRQRGIEAVAMVSGPDRLRVRSAEGLTMDALVWKQIDQWRNHVRQMVLASLDDPAKGLFLGMIIGEQRYIDQEVREDFMTTGTVHIISISGSHLGLLAFLSFLSVRGVTRRMPAPWLERLACWITPKQIAVILTIPLVVFYTVVSGAHVATVRSLLMILLYLIAVWFGHDRQILIALGISAGIAALLEPTVIYDLSFQLSYVSVLAIALAIRWMNISQEKGGAGQPLRDTMRKWVSQYFLISCAASLGTLPLVAYYFNQVAWLGIMANMIVVPFVGLTVVPLGLFSSILLLVFDLNDLPFAWIHQFLLGGLTSLVDILANIPGAELYVASPALLAMAVYYVCLLSAGLGVTPVFRTINAAVVTGLIVWWVWSPSQILDRQTLRATFLDVGQGDATLLEFPDGQVALIDGGAAYERWDMGRMVVGPYLWDQGIRTIDHLIATHPQLDHVGGLAWVIKHFHVRHYWTNGVQRTKPFYRRLHQAAREEDLNAQIAWAGQDLLQGNTCRMQSLNPPPLPTGASQPLHGLKSGEQLNNRSVVLSVSCGSHSILLPADAEVEALERMAHDPAVQAATLVKIPHHGAKSSFSAGWINHLTAQVAVVSAGQRNRYGHPIPAVLEEYEKNGIEVYRTDRDGAILITQNVDSMETTIQTARDQVLSVVSKEGNVLQQEIRNLRRLGRKWG